MRNIDDIKNIYCIPYVHADHSWTNTRQWHIKRYVEGMRRHLDYMKENKDYTFLIDNYLHFYSVIEKFLPERIGEIKKYVKEKRISIANGGKSLARPYNYGDELYLRNMVSGRSVLMEKTGCKNIELFLNADTGAGHSQLPQLIKKTGHSYYRFCRPEEALDSIGIPREFIWKGLDGSEVVTTRGYYGSFCDGKCFDYTNWEDKKQAFIDEDLKIKFNNMTSDNLFLNIGSDDTYPQMNVTDKEIDIDGFIKQWNENEKPKMFYSTPEECYHTIEKEDLPVWEGTFIESDLYFNVPMRSDLSLSRLRFETENLLLTAERLESILSMLGGNKDDGKINELWETAFTYSGHAMQFALDDDYAELLEKAFFVINSAKQYIRQLLERISVQAGSNKENTYLVINTCMYKKTETVKLTVTTAKHINGLKLYDEDGNLIPYQLIDTYNGDKPYVNKDYNEVVVAFTTEIPPMSIKRVYGVCDGETLVPKAEKEVFVNAPALDVNEEFVIDNGLFKFTVSQGRVSKICDGTGETNLGDFLSLRYYKTNANILYNTAWPSWSIDNKFSFVPETVNYTERGPERWSFVTKGTLNSLKASIKTTITKNSPKVDYTFTFNCEGDEGYFSVAFPCRQTPNIVAGIPFGSETRENKTLIKDDFGSECVGGFCANRFITFKYDVRKVMVTQGNCSYLYRHNEELNEIETFLTRSMDTEIRKETWMRYGHNSWSGEGINEFNFSVSFLEENAPVSESEKILSSERFPVCSVPVYSSPCENKKQSMEFKELPDNLTVTAFFKDGKNYVLRMYENSGKTAQFSLPKQIKKATICDLKNDKVKTVKVNDKVDYTISPWEIVTIKF